MNLLEPFTTVVDLSTGKLDPAREELIATRGELHHLYVDEPPAPDDVTPAYSVQLMPVPVSNSHLASATTVVSPGAVGREYSMTPGHFHAIRERSEIYICLSGEGRLLMADEDGDHRMPPMRRGYINYVPGGWAHRSVNVGTSPLVILSIYPSDAGFDFQTIEENGFPVLIVRGKGGEPEAVPNPRYRGRRS